MRTGSVKFYKADKGFGFIKDDQGGDVFFHVSAVDGRQDLTQGDRVEFEAVTGDRGEKAVRVVVI